MTPLNSRRDSEHLEPGVRDIPASEAAPGCTSTLTVPGPGDLVAPQPLGWCWPATKAHSVPPEQEQKVEVDTTALLPPPAPPAALHSCLPVNH